jgi:endonuclease YncB( thermonuclease family)
MKKSPLFLSLIAIATLLSGCGPSANPTSSEAVSSPSESTSSSITPIDYFTNGSVALSLDYAGKDFYKDGIGQVSLYTPIDGDTAHFTPLVKTTSALVIKSRFWGIDTPESTGQIQEYGKEASNFTTAQLEDANKNGTIVVSSPFTEYKVPEHDSTGTRYVSLIWVNFTKKNAPYTELHLLNLYIVQNGLSWVKNVADMPQYSDTFYAAEAQAKALKYNLFSGLPAPLFNYGDYEDISLLDIKREVVAKIKDPTHKNKYDGAKVRVTGTVAGYAGNILYIESYFNSETGSTVEGGEYAGVNIFTGMSAISSRFTKVNTYIQVSGVAEDSDNFGFQITGATFPNVNSDPVDPKEAEVLIKAADNTDEYSLYTFQYKTTAAVTGDAPVLTEGNTDALFCAVNLSGNVYCYNAYDSSDSNEHTLYLKSENASGETLFYAIYITFSYKPDAVNNPNLIYSKATDFVGHTFAVQGILGYHITTAGAVKYQILPRFSTDLVLVG